MTTATGWDDPRTASAYERFCHRHPRYREANEALVSHARLGPGQRVLDIAAGTGRTTDAVLPMIGAAGHVLCVEPAGAMRALGRERLRDPRVNWADELPMGLPACFDRVICGAAIWQLWALESLVAALVALLVPGGALAFNIPAQYLLQPDLPGGGGDPLLLDLPRLVDRSSVAVTPGVDAAATSAGPRDAAAVDALLAATGCRIEHWSFRVRLTQAAYRDWLKIPPVSEGLFAGLPPAERERRLDEAYQRSDHRSWRWERWLGWTAWQNDAR